MPIPHLLRARNARRRARGVSRMSRRGGVQDDFGAGGSGALAGTGFTDVARVAEHAVGRAAHATTAPALFRARIRSRQSVPSMLRRVGVRNAHAGVGVSTSRPHDAASAADRAMMAPSAWALERARTAVRCLSHDV